MNAFYQQRFANAADFTFFFVGAFKVDEITPLLATYLGVAAVDGHTTAKLSDLRLQFPDKVVREKVNKGQEPRSQTVMTFFADTGLDELETHRVQAATSVRRDAAARHPAREAGRHVLGRRRLLEHVARSPATGRPACSSAARRRTSRS